MRLAKLNSEVLVISRNVERSASDDSRHLIRDAINRMP
jgi:hypothetical protein